MVTFLATIHIITCLALVGLVLIQDSKGGGVFTSQTGSNSVLGAGGATTLAQTMTKVLAVIFAVTCISLSIIAARSQKSVVDGVVPMTTTPATVPAAAAEPATTTPSAQTEKTGTPAEAPVTTPNK